MYDLYVNLENNVYIQIYYVAQCPILNKSRNMNSIR